MQLWWLLCFPRCTWWGNSSTAHGELWRPTNWRTSRFCFRWLKDIQIKSKCKVNFTHNRPLSQIVYYIREKIERDWKGVLSPVRNFCAFHQLFIILEAIHRVFRQKIRSKSHNVKRAVLAFCQIFSKRIGELLHSIHL